MTTAGHFTRLAALNAANPNMAPPRDNARLMFVCDRCDEAYVEEDEAAECCRPEVLEQYECPVCKGLHRLETEADECCPRDKRLQPMKCPICMREADTFEIAADCCLHTHPTMTAAGRQRVAAAVAGGMAWPDAIEANATL
jgi:hypothetical protein